MAYLTLLPRCVTTALLSAPLLWLAILPARAAERANPSPPLKKVSFNSQQWSGQRGQLVIDWLPVFDDSRSPRAGSISALLRLGESEQQIPFVQVGYSHYPSGRTLNVGLGQRWWDAAATRWGVDLFYDYQFKEQHQRLGLGAEMQRDLVKLTVNGYLPLSHRRALKNTLTDFVKPARGIDASLDAYLPQHPWLGLRVGAEYYRGVSGVVQGSKGFKEVRYPTTTLGLNYTPVPLLTINYGYRLGRHQPNVHRVNLQLIYRFNCSLKAQLRPDQVSLWRTSQRSQLDVVSRRRSLVLNRTTRAITSNTPAVTSKASAVASNTPAATSNTPAVTSKASAATSNTPAVTSKTHASLSALAGEKERHEKFIEYAESHGHVSSSEQGAVLRELLEEYFTETSEDIRKGIRKFDPGALTSGMEAAYEDAGCKPAWSIF